MAMHDGAGCEDLEEQNPFRSGGEIRVVSRIPALFQQRATFLTDTIPQPTAAAGTTS